MVHRGLLALALAACLFAGLSCGGGGSRDDSADVTMSAAPLGAFDGIVQQTPIAFANNNHAWGAGCGEFYAGVLGTHEFRGFLTFDLTGLPPPPARVRAATLEVRQFMVDGTPYPSMGNVVIDHVALGPSLDTSDYDVGALDPAFAVVSSGPAVGGIAIDVTAQVGNDQVNGRPRSSFRLRFTAPMAQNGNVVDDFARFNDAEDHEGLGNLPKLTIIYAP